MIPHHQKLKLIFPASKVFGDETKISLSLSRTLNNHKDCQIAREEKNAFRKISYAIYETPYNDFGFCVAHTNVVQTKKTLDKLEQG